MTRDEDHNNGSDTHVEEVVLHHIDNSLGLPHDVWLGHLFAFLTTNQLLKIRLVSKPFSQLIYYYISNFKTEYKLRVGVSNAKFSNIIDQYLVKLKKLNAIKFEDYGLIATLSLTDVGLCDLGKINTRIETLNLASLEDADGSFLKEWSNTGSILLDSLQEMKLYNVDIYFFSYFVNFKNLKTLEVSRDEDTIELEERDMDEVDIALPSSLTRLALGYPITNDQMNQIVEQAPNLSELSVVGTFLSDGSIMKVFNSLKDLKKLAILRDFNYEQDSEQDPEYQGKFFKVFTDNTFKNLKELELTWFFTQDNKVSNHQKSLSSLSLSLDKLKLNFINVSGGAVVLDPLLVTLTNLVNLNVLSLHFPYGTQLNINSSEVLARLTQSLTKLKELTVENIGSGKYKELMGALVGPSLEKLKIINNDEHGLDLRFLSKCLNITDLEVDCEHSSDSLRDVFKEFQKQAAMLYQQKGVRVILPLKSLLGASITGGLLKYVPTFNITTLELIQVREKDLVYLKELHKLETLRLEFSDIGSFKGVEISNRLRNFVFENCTSLTGLEPGFVDLILSLNLNSLHFINCRELENEFVKQVIPLNQRELKSLFFDRCVLLTNDILPYLAQFTMCEVIVIQHCPKIQYCIDFSLFQQENPFISIIFEETDNENPDVNEEYSRMTNSLIDLDIQNEANYLIFEENLNDLLNSKQYYSAHLQLVVMLKDFRVRVLLHTVWSDERRWFIYYNFLKTLRFVDTLSDSLAITFEILESLNNLVEKCFSSDDYKKQDYFKILEKTLDHLDSRSFTKACDVLLEQKRYKVVIDAIYRIEELVGDRDAVYPLIQKITQVVLNGDYDVFEHYPVFYIYQMLESFVTHFPDNSNLDLIHHFMKIDFFKYHQDGAKYLDTLAKRVDGNDTFIDSIMTEYSEITDLNLDTIRERLPPTFQNALLYVATVNVPNGSSKECLSEDFEAFGYRWRIEFEPKGDDESDEDECSVYLTLVSTVPIGEDLESVTINDFDSIKVNYMICNYDVKPGSVLHYNKRYKHSGSSFGESIPISDYKPYKVGSKEENSVYKFIVGMKWEYIERTNWFFRNKEEISVHTLTLLSTRNIENGEDIYSDQFKAFGMKWCVCFYPKGETISSKDDKTGECSLFLALCSFDYEDEEDVVEYVNVRFMFANELYHSDSLYVGVSKFQSLSSSGNSIPNKSIYKPEPFLHSNGKTYDKYVINVALKMLDWKKRTAPRPEDDESEDEYYETDEEQ